MTHNLPPSSAPIGRASRWPLVVGVCVAVVSTVCIVAGYWSWRSGLLPPLPFITAQPEPEPPPPDASYAAARDFIESKRRTLATRFTAARTETERKQVLAEAHAAFADGVGRHLAPWWKDTPWDFNGTTQTPGQGKIACGYYVSTLLLHAGLQVERVRMAQQASLHIIHTLVDKDALVKGHSMPLAQFVDRIKACGRGLYVVGLDNHTGFLWNDGGDVWFLHSTVVGTRCVIKERATKSYVLGASKYRVAGHLSGNDALMQTWLTASPLPTKLPSA